MNQALLQRRDFIAGRGKTAPSVLDDFWLHVSRMAMACRFEITLPSHERDGVAAAQRALETVDRLEAQLSIFRDASEVSRLNRSASQNPVQVNKSLFSLLELSKELFLETERAFDITSGPLSHAWGFLRRQGRIPGIEQIEQARQLVGSERIKLDSVQRTVHFERAGVMINFGAIGKGYALDRVATSINRQIRAGLLSAGSSSMRAIGAGARGQSGWQVGIRHPRDPQRRLAILRLRNVSLSTSGHEEQFFEFEGRRYGHIIDPRTGQPSEGVSGVTVVHPSAAVADALATAFYVGGPELATRYCANHPNTLAIILESGSEEPVIFGANENCDVEIING